MATYTEHQQRMLDQNSLDPDSNWEAAAYNTLEKQQTPLDQKDIQYYLTRLEGQLVRLEEIFKASRLTTSPDAVRTLNSAQAFTQSLRNALDENRIDVA